MAFALAPILWGAGIGALSSMAFGKDPIKGAVLGGATGGLLDKIPAGALTGGSAQAAGTTVPTLSSIDPSSGVGAFVEGASTAGRIATDPLTGELLASQVPSAGVGAFTQPPSMFDELSPYLNVRDVSGAAQIASQYQPRPLPTPQSGQVSRGQAPEGNDVMSLIGSIKQPERRRLTLL